MRALCRTAAHDPKLTLTVGSESLGYSQPEGMETDKLSSSRWHCPVAATQSLSDLVCKEPAGSFQLFLGTRGMRSKLGRSDRVQEDAHVGGALRPEGLLELPLRFYPSLQPRPETGFAGRGHQ